MDERLSTLYLRNGVTARQYVLGLDQKFRQIAIEAILECSKLGYPLNNMEITSKARSCSARIGERTNNRNSQK